jgi:hypothetical protein
MRKCRFCTHELDKDTAHCAHPECNWCTACVRKRHEEARRAR